MSKYAEKTAVSAEKSRLEIEQTLLRYGADQFMYGLKQDAAAIAFRASGRNIRFLLPMPKIEDFKSYRHKGRTWPVHRTDKQQREAYEQDIRQRWRALCLCIKAKLEAVEAGITTFEAEFMAQIILPNGQTMSEHAAPMIERAYQSGEMPSLLPYFGN